MLGLVAALHVLVAIGIVVFVLLQDPKGGALGAFGGGASSNSLFGSTGASNFLSTTTKWLAIAFAATSLSLTYLSSRKSGSVLDELPQEPPAAMETAPTEAPPASTSPQEAVPQGQGTTSRDDLPADHP